jgi:hypothetical protein
MPTRTTAHQGISKTYHCAPQLLLLRRASPHKQAHGVPTHTDNRSCADLRVASKHHAAKNTASLPEQPNGCAGISMQNDTCLLLLLLLLSAAYCAPAAAHSCR